MLEMYSIEPSPARYFGRPSAVHTASKVIIPPR